MALESAGTDCYNFWNGLLKRLTKLHLIYFLRDQRFRELLFAFFAAINFPYFFIRHVLYIYIYIFLIYLLIITLNNYIYNTTKKKHFNNRH